MKVQVSTPFQRTLLRFSGRILIFVGIGVVLLVERVVSVPLFFPALLVQLLPKHPGYKRIGLLSVAAVLFSGLYSFSLVLSYGLMVGVLVVWLLLKNQFHSRTLRTLFAVLLFAGAYSLLAQIEVTLRVMVYGVVSIWIVTRFLRRGAITK